MRVQVGAFPVVKRSDIHGLPKSSVLDPVLFILLNSWIKIDYILIKSSDIKREGKEKLYQTTRSKFKENSHKRSK